MPDNSPKIRVARAVTPNVAVEARYSRRMRLLIDEMHTSVIYWLKAKYREVPPLIAQDASPVEQINKQLKALAKRWQRRFDDEAPRIAELYARESYKATDSAFRSALRDIGFAVKPELTPAMRDALRAKTAENVELIKSIPQEYLQRVQGSVMRSYAMGGDLEKMVRDIKRYYPQASNRAVLIARDQTNKANAVIVQTRRTELGLTQAIWKHSHAGKTPRPSHLAADGKMFDVSKGMFLDGKWVQPGEEINCRCVSRTVLPF